jgi:hypothetical protein
MTGREFEDGAIVSRYLVYKHWPPFPAQTWEEIKSIFQSGLMALQILKPVSTLGIVFYGHYASGGFSGQGIERRPSMEPGSWALKKTFDPELLRKVPSAIEGIRTILKGTSAERKNAFPLLQLGLEHFHPLIAGLLWVMGMEAIFNSDNCNDFKKKLCEYLGPSTRIFPDWNAHQPNYTVEETAIHLYTLRSKVAHGRDLREAMKKGAKFPVDFNEKHTLPNSSDGVPYSMLLSEAACYLLCQVLQKLIAECPTLNQQKN